ncbi:MAG: VOC family protein [Nitrososphaerales archaeon]
MIRKKTDNKRTSKSKQVRPIPSGFSTVTPYLVLNGADQAIEFYKKAFDAKEIIRHNMPDGKIMHAQIKIGNSIVMLSDEFEGSAHRSPASLGTSTVALHIYVHDVDKLWEQAISAGAKVVVPIDNQFWGERYGQLVDPFGHHWSVSKQIKMSPEEMETKRKAAMTMFASGEHPGQS